jgi:hypothetical protein
MKYISFLSFIFILVNFNGCNKIFPKFEYNSNWDIYLGEWENTQIKDLNSGYTYIQLSPDASYQYQLKGQKDRVLTVRGDYKIDANQLCFLTIGGKGGVINKKVLTINAPPYQDSLGQTHLHLNDIDYVKK